VRGAALLSGLAALASASACDFGAAFNRYCQDNPSCIPDTGTSLKNCDRPEDCAQATEVCHPHGKVCMHKCESSADCPVGEDSCQELDSGHPGPLPPKVCMCLSAQSCVRANAETTCSRVDNRCEKLCDSPADCSVFKPERFCDQPSGLCLIQPNCRSNADCTSAMQPRCDPSGICTRCMSPFDCSSRTDGLTGCDQQSGTCVAP
jgi:hypothetical protein